MTKPAAHISKRAIQTNRTHGPDQLKTLKCGNLYYFHYLQPRRGGRDKKTQATNQKKNQPKPKHCDIPLTLPTEEKSWLPPAIHWILTKGDSWGSFG